MLKPSSTLKPVVFDADPIAYQALGRNFPRGDKRRTMSRGELKSFAGCPNRWRLGVEEKATKALVFGDLVDVVVLTPQLFDRKIAVTPATYDKEGMKCPRCGSITDSQKCAKCKCDRQKVIYQEEWSARSETCQAWIAAQEKLGKTVVSPAEASEAWKAQKRLEGDPWIKQALAASKKQVQLNLEWHDPATGIVVPLKCLLDLVFNDPATLGDFKTTNDASYRAWRRTVHAFWLDAQAALYLDGYNVAAKAEKKLFEHIILESKPPYEPTHRPLSEEFLTLGRGKYRKALERYCRCLESGVWPGLDTSIVEPEVWMMGQETPIEDPDWMKENV